MLHSFKHKNISGGSFLLNFIKFIFISMVFLLIFVVYITIRSHSKENTRELSPIIISDDFTFTKKEKNMYKPITIGYLPSWSIAKKAIIYPEYLDQILYFGLGITENGEIMINNEQGLPLIEWKYFQSNEFIDIKKKAKETNTKLLIVIKNFDNTAIDKLISSSTNRKNAISNIVSLVSKYSLDGVNIDFEYFTSTDFPTQKYYNAFLTDLSKALKINNPEAQISVAINASAVYKDKAYDIVKIGEVVDNLIIMGYDYHTANSLYAGPVSPIDSEGTKPSLTKTINSLKGRIDLRKVIIALPFYGYEWQTNSRAYASKTIQNTGAIATYKRVRELIESKNDISISYDPLSQSPRLVYVQNGLIKQIYYEDVKSLKAKFSLISEQKLGGIGIWALGYEGEYIEPWELIKEERTTN